MKEFKREERYIVVKLKDQQHGIGSEFIKNLLAGYSITTCKNDCVIIESDWECYEDAWNLVEKEFIEK